ncbi:peroxiredoxin [Rubellimicrobium aerolatum]|uniref:thioredoxin-dependent peroxiredoxin n=1 Tax=Rubellimicrobium aerolatum TaxID=490979 RepID=A0ABW0SBZ2_9RHOB|nr:peroxiredoxin [Rubellimicrobium aerolatum]MBP1805969.1 peroxiredoxin Q/BCP [Rubellimicrobium aerolatum]
MTLSPGQIAPDFTLPRDGGGAVSLADLRGRAVVLFFYPADDTPGCTTEAQDFTALLPRLEAAGAAVLGISGGTVAAKEKFIAKAGLGVPLLADEGGEVIRAYGAWGEKSMYGKTYTGLIRTTVLLNAEGKVVRTWTVRGVKGHAEQVAKAAEDLRAPS